MRATLATTPHAGAILQTQPYRSMAADRSMEACRSMAACRPTRVHLMAGRPQRPARLPARPGSFARAGNACRPGAPANSSVAAASASTSARILQTAAAAACAAQTSVVARASAPRGPAPCNAEPLDLFVELRESAPADTAAPQVPRSAAACAWTRPRIHPTAAAAVWHVRPPRTPRLHVPARIAARRAWVPTRAVVGSAPCSLPMCVTAEDAAPSAQAIRLARAVAAWRRP